MRGVAHPIASCAPAERLDGPSLEPRAHDARARERLEKLPLERAHRLVRVWVRIRGRVRVRVRVGVRVCSSRRRRRASGVRGEQQ